MKKFLKFTKENPSPKYFDLIRIYSDMHSHGIDSQNLLEQKKIFKSENTFPGIQTLKHAPNIKKLCDLYKPSSLLDFGSGKSGHYKQPVTDEAGNKFNSLKDYWGLSTIETYEPAIGQSTPSKKYDACICTDVIEHIYFADVFWTIKELFNLSKKFVYLNIACKPTVNYFLPNGENAHITIRSPNYWHGVLDAISSEYEGIDYVLGCSIRPPNKKTQYVFFRRKDLSDMNGNFTVVD